MTADRIALADARPVLPDGVVEGGQALPTAPSGPSRVTLITVMLLDGRSIVGSSLTLDFVFKRSVTVGRLALSQAVESISEVPARLLALSDSIGLPATGTNADLVLHDVGTYELVEVMRCGRRITGGQDPPGEPDLTNTQASLKARP